MQSKEQFVLSQLLSAASNEFAFDKASHDARESAIELLPLLLDNPDALTLNETTLGQLTTIYFLCTYCHTPKKHDVKLAINRVLRKALLAAGIQDIEAKPVRREKPRVLVVTNHFHSSHVMYRVFGKSLAAMKEQFECVALSMDTMDFVSANACFHRVYQVNLGLIHWHETMMQLRKLVAEIQPDIILYADIAMHPYCIFLSNLRLAPIQTLIFGHPAPSMSAQMDAFICEEGFAGAFNSRTWEGGERMCHFEEDAFSIREPLARPFYPDKPTTPRILIPATLHKVTYPFLQSIKTVQQLTDYEIHVMGNTTQHTEELQERLRVEVPGIVLHPSMHYDQYMKFLGTAEFFMMTYPFSGFWTVADCFAQSLPGVLMDGAGMEALQGSIMNRRAGNGAYIEHTQEQFISRGIRMAIEPDMREGLSFHLGDIYDQAHWPTLPLYSGRSEGIANTLKGILDTHQDSGG